MIGSVLNGIQVSDAISYSRSSNGTLYTAPANGYAIINCYAAAGTGTFELLVGGATAYRFSDTANTGTPQSGVSGNAIAAITIYVGPSQAVAIGSYSGTKVLNISGVEFVSGT